MVKAVTEVKAGKIDFKVDKYGIIHAGIGKVSFDAAKIKENAQELIQTLIKMKPTAAKRNLCEEHLFVFYNEPVYCN